MVRATLVRVQIRLAGDNPPGIADADITSMLTQADYVGDGYTWPTVLSQTDDIVIELFVSIVMNMLAENTWFQAGGYLSGQPRPEILTREVKDTLDRLGTISAKGGVGVVKGQSESQ